MKWVRVYSWLKRHEPWIFLLVALVNLMPVFAGKYFPTLDGAAHLYNANIIKELFLNSDTNMAAFYEFNSTPVPNWTGHFILAFLRLFFPAYLAEKCLLVVYLFGLPYAFRSLVSDINPKNSLSSYLIFPFCYTGVFLLGFYNFSIGILMFFVVLSAWIKWENRGFTRKKWALFTLLFILLYFSHLVVFAVSIGVILGRMIYLNGYYHWEKKSLKKTLNRGILLQIGFLLLTALLPIILLIQYFINKPVLASSKWLSNKKLISSLYELESLIGFNYDLERKFTIFILCAILLLIIFILVKRIRSGIKIGKLIQQNDYWLFAALGVLVLYFILPNESSSAGFVSIRLNLIFFLLLICWMASQHINKTLLSVLIPIILFCNLKLNEYYFIVSYSLNNYANNITSCAKYIEYGSTVIPLNYSENWLSLHFSNYLAVDKNLLVMDNYEATLDYFPITWTGADFPNMTIGEKPFKDQECTTWLTNPYSSSQQANYVFIFGSPILEGCNLSIKQELNAAYSLIYSKDMIELYKRK